jgi:hypothetical protein
MRDEKISPSVSLDAILGDFGTAEPEHKNDLDASVTIWIPANYKARFQALQSKTRGKNGRKFSAIARDTLLALIELAEKRAG